MYFQDYNSFILKKKKNRKEKIMDWKYLELVKRLEEDNINKSIQMYEGCSYKQFWVGLLG